MLARRVWYGDSDSWPCVPWRFGGYLVGYNEGRTTPCAFSIALEIETAHDIDAIESPTHDIKCCYADGASIGAAAAAVVNRRSAAASLWSDTAPMDRDFVLKIRQVRCVGWCR